MSLLYPDAFISPLQIDDAVTRALDEDLGRAGDVTSIATVPEAAQAAPFWSPASQALSPACRSSSLRFAG